MTDTEDPNIATLREFLRSATYYRPHARIAGFDALSALASTLAERDRRIAAQEATLRIWQKTAADQNATLDLATRRALSLEEELRQANERLRALEAPPAPAPGELAHLHCRECNYHPSEPINCAQCGASYCMTREPMPALNGGDDNG